MELGKRSQGANPEGGCRPHAGRRGLLITPNPKLKLLDQVREVMRLKHYSLHTERSYCDWVRRYIKFHHMASRDDLAGAEQKIELFLPLHRAGASAVVGPVQEHLERVRLIHQQEARNSLRLEKPLCGGGEMK